MKKITLLLVFGLVTSFGKAQTLQWAKQLSGSSAVAFSVDVKDVIAGGGFVYVCGSFTGTVDFDINSGVNNKVASGIEGFIAKYNANDGSLAWVTTTNSGFNDIQYLKIKFAITTSGTNNSYINLLIKEGVSGFRFLGINVLTGAQAYSSPSYNADVSLDPLNFYSSYDGKHFIVGKFSGTLTVGTTSLVSAGGNDAFIVRMTLAGNLTITTDIASRYGGTGEDVFNDISTNTYGDEILAAGSFTGTFSSEYSNNTTYSLVSAGLKDGIVIQFALNSTTLKPANSSRVYTFGSTGNDEATNIQGGFTSGGANNYVVIGGNFTGTVDFDFSSASNTRTSAGSTDAFIAGYSANSNSLNFVFTTIEGGASEDTLGDFNDTFTQNGLYYSVNRGNPMGGSFISLGSCSFTGTALTFSGQMTAQAATTQLKSSSVFYIAPNANDWFTVGNFNGTSDFDPDSATTFNLSSVSSANNGFIQRIKICTTAGTTSSITASSPQVICGAVPSSITLNLTGSLNESFKWVWYSGSCGGTLLGEGTSVTVNPASLPVTYYVRGEGGCAGNGNCASITFTSSNPIATVTQTGNMLSSNQFSATSYQWIDCNNGNAPISGATDQDFTPTVSGSYAVIVSNNTCSITSQCISVLSNPTFEQLGIKLYPNPIKNHFTIVGDEVINLVTIYNLLGQKVKEFSGNESYYDVNDLSSGTFIIEVATEKGKAKTKIIKE